MTDNAAASADVVPAPPGLSEATADPQTMPTLDSDSHLDQVKLVEGYKVLPPCVLYGKIGQGGMGAVYRGRHLNLDIDVAVKCLKPELTGEDEQFIVRFRREARSAARINHQNVVRVFDVSEEHGLHYIVMELVQGETARQRVQRKQQLQVGEALEILWGAANGLGEAHSKGFIHRDIKPDNIMISQTGQVKVADLGLAKPSGVSQMSMLSGTNVVMGTPQYMPPEQWENTATVTPAADVWALGATLYYLLVGGEAIAKDSLPRIMQRIVLQPFPDVREQRADVPADVAELIAKATAKDPGDRFVDARAMANAIERLETRRESLRDAGAVSDGEHNTLVSPPPAKTLAKIKFWLDEQTQQGSGGQAVVANPGATMAMAPPTAAAAGTGSSRRWLGLAVVALLAVVVGVWQPWRAANVFEEADRLEQAGQFELAIVAALRIHAADPALPGKAERLSRLHASRAEGLLTSDRIEAALVEVERSLDYAVNAAANECKQAALARAVSQIEAGLRRTAPVGQSVARVGSVRFEGRCSCALVRELRIAEQTVAIGTNGMFAVRIDAEPASVAVAAVMTTGDVVPLRSWSVTYQAPAGQPAGPLQVPVEPAAAEPQARPEAPAKPVVAEVAVEIDPAQIELSGEQAGTLTVRAAPTASIYIDGQPVQRRVGELGYVHRVQSTLDEPAAVVVLVREPGKADVQRSVPVVRVTGTLQFVRPPSFVGLRRLRDQRWATASTSVMVQGQLDDGQARLLLNGKPVEDVEWRERTFTFRVPKLAVGENRLRLRAERRFFRAAEADLAIYRLQAPKLGLAAGTKLADSVAATVYDVVLSADEWTERVEAGSESGKVRLELDRASGLYRGRVRLLPGMNQIPIRAVNVLDQESLLELRIERLAASARPQLQTVELSIDGELLPVRARKQVFVRAAVPLRVTASDPAAAVTINRETVERTEDGLVAIAKWLNESRPSAIEIVLENDAGRSQPFRFFVWLDTTAPEVQWQPLAQPVAKGKPFELRGSWIDRGGLQRDGSKLAQLAVRVTPRGVAPKGNWTVMHPGLEQSTELQLVVVDRAGNRTTLPLRIEVQ